MITASPNPSSWAVAARRAGRLIPYAVFIEPELGRVGLNETEAKRQGIAYRLAKLPVAVIPRARTLSETRGLMKAVIEADGDGILGFTMLGAQAGEVIAAIQTAMWGRVPYTAFPRRHPGASDNGGRPQSPVLACRRAIGQCHGRIGAGGIPRNEPVP